MQFMKVNLRESSLQRFKSPVAVNKTNFSEITEASLYAMQLQELMGKMRERKIVYLGQRFLECVLGTPRDPSGWDLSQLLPHGHLLLQNIQTEMSTESVNKTEVIITCHLTIKVTSHHFCHIFPVGNNLEAPPTFQGRGLHKDINTRRWGSLRAISESSLTNQRHSSEQRVIVLEKRLFLGRWA